MKNQKKMTKQTKKPQFALTKFNASQIKNFEKYEERQRELVAANPFIEVVDKESYKIGRERRTALVTGRTDIQKERDAVKKELNGIKKFVSDKYDSFIEISVVAENEQQESVKKHEAILDAEKEKERLIEENRATEIRGLIIECERSLSGIIVEMTHDTIEDSQQKFDATVDSEHYGSDVLQEFEFLFKEMIAAMQERFNAIAEKLIEAEQRRIDELKMKQQSLINELYVQANEQIEMITIENARVIKLEVIRIFEIDFDFGEFTEKLQSKRDQLIKKTDDRIDQLIQEHDERQILHQKQEISNQKNRIIAVREGLLDLVFQMNVDNYEDQKDLINKTMKRPNGLFDELVPEWEKSHQRVNESFERKCEIIDAEKANEQSAKDERSNARLKKIDELGMEFDDEFEKYFLTGSDLSVFKISLEETSNETWDEFISMVESFKAENKIHNERWDSRKPELEKLGFQYDENRREFIGDYDLYFSVDLILKQDDKDWKIWMETLIQKIKEFKESDEKEITRQESLAGDKQLLIDAVENISFPDKDFKMSEIDELRLKMDVELEQWKKTKIEIIKNF